MAEMVKKYKIAPFFKGSEGDWVRIKKSTAFDLSLNPETQDFDYICDEVATTEVMKYKPSLNQALTMYKGEEDYEFVFDKFYNLATGSDAETEFLLVFFQEKSGETYKAWKCKGVIAISDLNSVDSTITFDLYLNGNIDKGSVTVDESGKPTFAPAE